MSARRGFAVACFFGICGSRAAIAQTPELDRARAAFSDALSDQQSGRNDVALEKFRRVAAVRDTAQVEYRIGSCLEALGHKRPALVAYDHAARLGRADPDASDVVSAANDRIATLAHDMGKLGVVVHGSDAKEVRVDGELITADELSAVVLEPGEHAVDVTAPGEKPAHATVSISRGARLELTVNMSRAAQAPRPPEAPPSYVQRNVGIAVLAVGAAFAIGSGAVLLVRNNLIDSIHTICPNDMCPVSQHDNVESMRSTASGLELPAAVLGGVALAGVVTGIVLVALGPQHRATAAVVPSEHGAAFFFRSTF